LSQEVPVRSINGGLGQHDPFAVGILQGFRQRAVVDLQEVTVDVAVWSTDIPIPLLITGWPRSLQDKRPLVGSNAPSKFT